MDKEKTILKIVIIVIFPFPHFTYWINESTSWTNTITIEMGKTINIRRIWSMSDSLQVKPGYARYHIRTNFIQFKNSEPPKVLHVLSYDI